MNLNPFNIGCSGTICIIGMLTLYCLLSLQFQFLKNTAIKICCFVNSTEIKFIQKTCQVLTLFLLTKSDQYQGRNDRQIKKKSGIKGCGFFFLKTEKS